MVVMNALIEVNPKCHRNIPEEHLILSGETRETPCRRRHVFSMVGLYNGGRNDTEKGEREWY